MRRTKAPKPAPHPALAAWLADPACATDLAGLCAQFRVTRVSFLFERPPDLEGGFRLAALMRAALGRPLKALADARAAQGDENPQLWHAMFADHDWPGQPVHFPKPFVIWVTERERRILVEISLFGEAGRWRDDLIEAMARVMLPKARGGEGGVSLGTQTRARRPWPLRDVFWRVREGIAVPPAPGEFVLRTLTPLITGSDLTQKGDWPRLVAGLRQRLMGLARWHGLDVPELAAAPEASREALKVEPLCAPRPAGFARRSRTFGRAPRVERGVMGQFMVRDYPRALWPCFVLATYAHMGHGIPQGAGRVAITL